MNAPVPGKTRVKSRETGLEAFPRENSSVTIVSVLRSETTWERVMHFSRNFCCTVLVRCDPVQGVENSNAYFLGKAIRYEEENA